MVSLAQGDSVSSYRWQKDRKLTDRERATFWEQEAMQLRSELNRADKTLQRLTLRLARREKELAEYRQCFGPMRFDTPGTSEDAE